MRRTDLPVALRPAPDPDEASRPFFEAARLGRLVYQRCQRCDAAQLGRMLCQQCFGSELEWFEASGQATVHSFVAIHLTYHPAFESESAYVAAIVELDEGPRLPVYVAVAPGHARPVVGDVVRVEFECGENDIFLPIVRR